MHDDKFNSVTRYCPLLVCQVYHIRASLRYSFSALDPEVEVGEGAGKDLELERDRDVLLNSHVWTQ